MASLHKRSDGQVVLRARKPSKGEGLTALCLAAVAGICALVGIWQLVNLSGVWAVAFGGDYLLSLRPSQIVLADSEIRTRSRLGFKDRRPIDGLLTVEWHSGYAWPPSFRRWWTATLRSNHGQYQPRFDTIVFNYQDMSDNVQISGRGFVPADVRRLADKIGVHFIDFSSTTGNPERDHDHLKRIAEHREIETQREAGRRHVK